MADYSTQVCKVLKLDPERVKGIGFDADEDGLIVRAWVEDDAGLIAVQTKRYTLTEVETAPEEEAPVG